MNSETTKTEQKATQDIQAQTEGSIEQCPNKVGNNAMKTEATISNQDSLTQNTVHKLTRLATDNWVGIGKEINDYIHNAASGSARIDQYKELAEHKDCPFKDSHLRNYVSGFRLWQQLGGHESAPTLSLAHYLLVVPSRIPEFKKRFYLKYAQEHSLNASQFREYLEKELKLIPDLTKYLGKSLLKLQERISDINCRDVIKCSPDLKIILRLTIAQIFAQKLLTVEEVTV